VFSVPPTRHSALTVFTESKAGRNSQLSLQEARHKGEQSSASPHPEVNSQQSRTWLVKAKENIVVAPRCREIVLGRLESEKKQSPPPLVCVEPAQIPIEGILPARVLSRVELNTQETSQVTSQNSHTETGVPNHCAYIMLANFSNEPLVVPKATVLGITEEISEPLVDSINAGCKSDTDSPTKPCRRKKNEA